MDDQRRFFNVLGAAVAGVVLTAIAAVVLGEPDDAWVAIGGGAAAAYVAMRIVDPGRRPR